MAQLKYLKKDGSQPELFRPNSTWEPHTGPLPMWSGVDVGIDTEERDDGLLRSMGPGWVYDLGHVCGVSVATADQSMYIPLRHPETDCYGLHEVLAWVTHLLQNCTCHFFNAAFDLAWLWQAGLRTWPERFHDAYISSVLLGENELEYSLDGCCSRAGIKGKDQRLLEDAARSYGVDAKSGMWRMPARFIGPYAEQDARSTLALSLSNLRQIVRDGLEGAYRTEIDLVRVIYDMRRRGIRINEDKAEQSIAKINIRRDAALERIRHLSGFRVDMHAVRSPDALGKIFETCGITCPRTPKSNKPSVTKEWLATLDHDVGEEVRHARQFDDLSNKFMKGYILDNLHRGRIHAEVHQLRDGEGGTRTFRLSYSNPPLQQMPARADPQEDPLAYELVQEIRSCFEPEQGEVWAAPDYSGQEPRFLVHLASATGMPGGPEMARRYQENPRLDYHLTVAGLLGWPRKKAKDINQGLAYGMGKDKLARDLRISVADAEDILAEYNRGMPYVKKLEEHCGNLAKQRGYIKLIDGARCHFDAWQPAGARGETAEWGLERARRRWPGKQLERAFTYRALNRACQGGSARQMKTAMVGLHRAGLKILISMHDEVGLSISSREEALMAQDIMVNAVRLEVPMLVDLECGPDWGHAKHSVEEVFG